MFIMVLQLFGFAPLRRQLNVAVLSAAILFSGAIPGAAQEQVTAFRLAVAQAAASDPALSAFYRARQFDGIWSGPDDHTRRSALVAAFAKVDNHGLPSDAFDPDALIALMQSAQTPQERGQVDVEISRLFLQYARNVQTGLLVPSEVDSNIRREVPYRDGADTLHAFVQARPAQFIRSLPPQTPEYTRLMRQKFALEAQLTDGGWGPSVPTSSKLELGDRGAAVVALRNRLVAMGFLQRTNAQSYDAAIMLAVRAFQDAHGLAVDGTAGPTTLAEINVTVEQRLQAVMVAMERERWLNRPRGDRHIWVNLTDFSAQIIDHDVVTYQTRSVIGATDQDRMSPEFSDEMEHMVINPSWYVPRSIATKEYLPQLRRNPYARSELEIRDRRGRIVNRATANFANYTASNFPYSMRQPPSRSNALGLVKFMFPNQYNIYLHDTPAKSLFGRETRAFSHGCIRLNDPFDFAYALLAVQTDDPEAFFQEKLASGREHHVDLDAHVPVHLVYRTAFTRADGQMQYRRDVYGRDARIWDALAREGVAIRAVRS